MVRRLAALVGWTFCALLISIPAHAFQLAVSQYGRVTASLP